jgi:hypothetical protein
MYSESARMIFLRALASYSRNNDIVPMARILYNSLILDPETLAAIEDPSWSDAVYYGVECLDYAYFSGTPEERADAYLRAGDPLDENMPRMSSVFYGDLPCVFWPNSNQVQSRPAPLTADGIPTLVLGGIADPVTPISNGQGVFGRLSDGYLVTETGGPHVIFGWGVSCVDDLVTAFLVEDQLPERRTSCEGEVTRAFVPLAPLHAEQFEDPLAAMRSVDNEIYYLPEYYYWDVTTPTSIGCPFGGNLGFEPSDDGESFTFSNCAFTDDFVMTGSGSYNYDDGRFTIEVEVTGLEEGILTYWRDADDIAHVTGEFGGEAIDLSE